MSSSASPSAPGALPGQSGMVNGSCTIGAARCARSSPAPPIETNSSATRTDFGIIVRGMATSSTADLKAGRYTDTTSHVDQDRPVFDGEADARRSRRVLQRRIEHDDGIGPHVQPA